MIRPRRILILGGTSEAAELAGRLSQRVGEFAVTTSLAGRTAAPTPTPGRTRLGGFGGVPGLIRHLREVAIDAVVDATHPFAGRMPWNASAACAATAIPLVRIERAPWRAGPGDRWIRVPDLAGASAALAGSRRVFLTTGRQDLAPFADNRDIWFLVRSIDPPGALPFNGAIVLAKGPFSVEGERALMARNAIDTLVTKNSGAAATAAKLEAARDLGVGVVMVERPPKPPGSAVADVDGALEWLAALDARIPRLAEAAQ